jgi:uncharacterized protein
VLGAAPHGAHNHMVRPPRRLALNCRDLPLRRGLLLEPSYAVANRRVARIVAASRGRLYGFAFIHPVRDAGRVLALVREAVEAHDFRGIKVHRLDARITREICDVARQFGVPVLYDVVGEVETVELLAGEYPDVAFIIPHLGSFADEWRAQVAMIGLLMRHGNVHADTSAVRRFDLLQEAARRRPRQVLFRSDGPWLHPGVELEKVRLLGLRATDERRVLGANALRLIDVRRQSLPVSVGLPRGGRVLGPRRTVGDRRNPSRISQGQHQ